MEASGLVRQATFCISNVGKCIYSSRPAAFLKCSERGPLSRSSLHCAGCVRLGARSDQPIAVSFFVSNPLRSEKVKKEKTNDWRWKRRRWSRRCSAEASNGVTSEMQVEDLPLVSVFQVEVCTGKKCSKSGAEDLLEAFTTRLAGIDSGGAVSECKCLEKCRHAPNIRVTLGKMKEEEGRPQQAGQWEGVDHVEEVFSSVPPTVCVGIRVEDVETIVSNILEGTFPSSLVHDEE